MSRKANKKKATAKAKNAIKVSSIGTKTAGPKSMVIRVGAGEVGPSVSQLVHDVRSMMEPDTAVRLRERKSNRLRDYTTMAGPLGVSHLLLFSRSKTGNTNLRIALTPRGPTLHFRVENYSLCKDVKRAMRHPIADDKMHQTPPLLVMNHIFSPEPAEGELPLVPKHLETLTHSVLQSLFPQINPQTTPVGSIRRVMLWNRELPKKEDDKIGAYTINVRHYAITTKRTGLTKSIRKINAAERIIKNSAKKSMPNLHKLEDVADYILNPSAAASGFTSGSDTEAETDAEVEVLNTSARKLLSKKKQEAMQKRGEDPNNSGQVEKKAVKLVELGPRLKLRMTKVEEGVCSGKTMWHEYIALTRQEERQQEQDWDRKKQEKEERKRIQKENIAKKRGKDGEAAENDEDEWDSEGLIDADDDDDEDADEKDVDAPLRAPIS